MNSIYKFTFPLSPILYHFPYNKFTQIRIFDVINASCFAACLSFYNKPKNEIKCFKTVPIIL